MMRSSSKIFFILIGIFLVSFILYNRLFKLRIPKLFTDFSEGYYLLLNIIVILFMFIALLITIFHYYKFLVNMEPSSSKLMIFYQKLYNSKFNPVLFAINSMIEFDAFLKNNIPYYNEHFSYGDLIIFQIAKNCFNSNIKSILLIFIFKIIPQITVIIAFSYDILFLNKFLYFYQTLWLLIFPLLLNYITYSIKTFIDTNLNMLNDLLSLKIIYTKDITQNTTLNDFNDIDIYQWKDLLLTPEGTLYTCYNNLSPNTMIEYQNDPLSGKYMLNFSLNLMNDLFNLDYRYTIYNYYKTLIETPFNIVKYLIYTIGWSNILFNNINHFFIL